MQGRSVGIAPQSVAAAALTEVAAVADSRSWSEAPVSDIDPAGADAAAPSGVGATAAPPTVVAMPATDECTLVEPDTDAGDGGAVKVEPPPTLCCAGGDVDPVAAGVIDAASAVDGDAATALDGCDCCCDDDDDDEEEIAKEEEEEGEEEEGEEEAGADAGADERPPGTSAALEASAPSCAPRSEQTVQRCIHKQDVEWGSGN